MGFTSGEEIKTRAKAEDCQLWEAILHDDMTERQVDRLESIGKMSSMYLAMKEANENYDKDLRSIIFSPSPPDNPLLDLKSLS